MDLFFMLLLTVLGSVIVGTGFLFVKLRPKFPCRVNCWFCNKNTKVPYENRNEWTCPFCDQYNGFSSDGGYNKPIPAQCDPHMNKRIKARNQLSSKVSTASKFCRSCTINQQLKIQQLASFVPIDEDNFDEEVEQYRVHLERAYALCPSCESVLKDTLTTQKEWLLGLQTKEKCRSYLKGKQQIYGRLLATASSNVHIARALSASICTIMLASTAASGEYVQIPSSLMILPLLLHDLPASESLLELLLLSHRSVGLAAAGMLFQVVAALGAGTNGFRYGICGIAGWAFLLLQYWASLHLPLKEYIRIENTDNLHAVSLLATLTFSILPFLVPRVSKSTFKKIHSDSFKRSDTFMHAESKDQAREVSELNGNECLNWNKNSSHFTKKYSSEIGIQKKVCDAMTFRDTDSIRDCKPRTPNEVCVNAKSMSGPYSHFHRTKCYGTDSYFEQDLHHGLCSLSLGTAPRPRSRRWAFESRVYGGKEFSGLFSATDNRPRPLLSPPRFGVHRNVTRSPWSAGGYWQTPASFAVGHDGSPLSRSSSRSSGFGSMSSRAAAAYETATAAASPPGSHAGSVCAGDADQFSVHSLPAYPPNFPPTYFPFYGAPYFMPHVGGYAVSSPYCFSPPPASVSPQSSPALSDSDSSCASHKVTKSLEVHRGFVDILKSNTWLSFVIGSSLFLNAVATVFFILTNRNFLTGAT